jgi:hypothetical protein
MPGEGSYLYETVKHNFSGMGEGRGGAVQLEAGRAPRLQDRQPSALDRPIYFVS